MTKGECERRKYLCVDLLTTQYFLEEIPEKSQFGGEMKVRPLRQDFWTWGGFLSVCERFIYEMVKFMKDKLKYPSFQL